jgi:ElaB/YqjD/DUF883 family membrane-anchored ribosome-binding protein
VSVPTEKLVADVKVLVNDTEELVKATVSQAGDKATDIRRRAQESVKNLKPHMASLEAAVVDKAKSTATSTNAYVHENPWAAAGIAAGIGLLLGLLISRR